MCAGRVVACALTSCPLRLSGQQDREPGQRRRGRGGSRSQRGVTGDRGGRGEHRRVDRRDKPGGLGLP